MRTRAIYFALLAYAAPAWAQDAKGVFDDDTKKDDQAAATDSDEIANVYDDPNATNDAVTTDNKVVAAATPQVQRITRENYPQELVLRPLNVPRGLTQVALDVPVVINEPAGTGHQTTMTQVLRGRYGVTDEIQAGLTYAVGLARLAKADGQESFVAGKSFSLDGQYALVPGLVSASLSVPFYTDPFAMGVILGAPLRLHLGEKFTVFLGEDLVYLRVAKFPPKPDDPGYNQEVADGLTLSAPTIDGNLNAGIRAVYQVKPNLAVFGSFNVWFIDFSSDKPPTPLFAGVSYTHRQKLDLGARLGIGGFDSPHNNLSIGLFAAYRL